MNVFIFANCQGAALLHFFPAGYKACHRHNYQYIHNTVLDDEIKSLLMECDYFIYQPLSSSYPVYNTDNLKTYLKSSCIAISFPYMFNDAFTPLYKSVKRDVVVNGEYSTHANDSTVYKNTEPILELKSQGLSLDDVLQKYNAGEIDFRYKERFDKTIAILKDKERYTDVKVSQFILDNHRKCRLFNYHTQDAGYEDYSRCNHPSNVLIVEYVNQIFKLMELPSITYNGPELIYGTLYPSKCCLQHYKYEWICSDDTEIMDTIVKKLITEIYTLNID